MQKYVYITTIVPATPHHISAACNQGAADGWRFVAMTPTIMNTGGPAVVHNGQQLPNQIPAAIVLFEKPFHDEGVSQGIRQSSVAGDPNPLTGMSPNGH